MNSSATLYLVYAKRATLLARYPSADGTVDVLWRHVWERWLHGEGARDAEKIFEVAVDPNTPTWLRWTLGFTFPRFVVSKPHASQLAESCRRAYEWIEEPDKEVVNHWRSIADDVEKHAPSAKGRWLLGFALGGEWDPWSDWSGTEKPYDLVTKLEEWAKAHEQKRETIAPGGKVGQEVA